MAILAGLLAVRLWTHIRYPFPLDLGEGTVISSAWFAGRGEPVYRAILQPPYIFTIYNPLLVYLGALVFRVFGWHLAGLRIITSAFFIGSAVVVYRFVVNQTGVRTAGVAAALFLVVERHFFSRAGYAVTDFPAIFFSLLGLYFWRLGGRRRYWAIAAFSLAFFSKQTSVAAAAAAIVSMYLEGRRGESVRLLGLLALAIGAGFAICALFFGRIFFVNTIQYPRVAPFSGAAALRGVGVALGLYAFVAGGWLWMLARARRDRGLLLAALYVLFGLLFSFAVGRQGASRSYFFDFAAGLSIVAGYMWAWMRQHWAAGGRAALAAAAVALQMVLIVTGTTYGISPMSDKTRSDFLRDSAVKAMFVEHPGVILCRDGGFEPGTEATGATNDLCKMLQLMGAGALPRDIFLRPAEQGVFSAAIVPGRQGGESSFGAGLLEALETNYVVDHEVLGEKFFVPRRETEEAGPGGGAAAG